MDKLAVLAKEIDLGTLEGVGRLGSPGDQAGTLFNRFLTTTIGLMTIVAIIWFVFLLISGAYGMMSAGGDKTALEGARKRIATGLIGFIIVIAAVFLVDLIGALLGIENVLNPAEALKTILNLNE